MTNFKKWANCGAVVLSVAGAGCRVDAQVIPQPDGRAATAKWEQAGWGGGGWYWAAAFHPKKNGVIYMGGDVLGVYKSVDSGRNWRITNNGLTDYGVYSLAVDRTNPETVYAASEGGLYKSTDAGENWTLLPRTGRKELRITGERGVSVRSVTVDPTNGNNLYAASPIGKIYKSTDGGQNWTTVYSQTGEATSPDSLRVQYGKVNDNFFGGLWLPIKVPAGLQSADLVGFGFAFKGNGTVPQKAYVTLKTASGASYLSRNVNELFKNNEWRDVLLRAEDFTIDQEWAKKNAEAAKTLPATPDWSTINRMDLSAVGSLPTESLSTRLGRIFVGVTKTPDGQTAAVDKPILLTAREFTTDKAVQTYGNIRIGEVSAPAMSGVEVSPKKPTTVLAFSRANGLLLSKDAGATWNPVVTPAPASAGTLDPANPDVIYAGFGEKGIGKSTDGGVTWTTASEGFAKGVSFRELVVSPTDSQDVYAIGTAGWGGIFYASHDGGKTWTTSSTIVTDPIGNPTLPAEGKKVPLSSASNLAINPLNPKQLFISANWRSCLSEDAGVTWNESDRGADISVITDVRFSDSRVYASAMDEGTLMSENNGQQWSQLWPLKWSPEISGHNWRLAINKQNGVDRIISTVSPWDKYPPRTVLSEDGGKTYKVVTAGLPDYIIRPNTMWGAGHPRALAVDPQNSQIVYMGIDGDAEPGKSGGGLFKSLDGGASWKQLAHQPGSRRMFYGLMVDPTDSKRIYWAALGNGGGVWRSEDSGESWTHVFNNEGWPFNLMVARDGTAYCAGKYLWRSTDKGTTWKKITDFSPGGTIMGLEEDPRDNKTLWISFDKGKGGVYKTTDGGVSWKEITANLPYIYPMLLRFNPATNELWAAGVGLYKLKQ